MNEQIQQQLKDLVFNTQSYLHWYDEYNTEGYWECIKKMNNHLERIRELLPVVTVWLREHDFDDLCG